MHPIGRCAPTAHAAAAAARAAARAAGAAATWLQAPHRVHAGRRLWPLQPGVARQPRSAHAQCRPAGGRGRGAGEALRLSVLLADAQLSHVRPAPDPRQHGEQEGHGHQRRRHSHGDGGRQAFGRRILCGAERQVARGLVVHRQPPRDARLQPFPGLSLRGGGPLHADRERGAGGPVGGRGAGAFTGEKPPCRRPQRRPAPPARRPPPPPPEPLGCRPSGCPQTCPTSCGGTRSGRAPARPAPAGASAAGVGGAVVRGGAPWPGPPTAGRR